MAEKVVILAQAPAFVYIGKDSVYYPMAWQNF